MEEPKSPSDKDDRPKSSSPSIQREEEQEIELAEELERTLEEPPTKRRPAWFKETLQEAERQSIPLGTFKESRRPQKFAGYVAMVSQRNDAEPTLYEEATKHWVWKDAMVDEYNSIMKNEVWEVVPRPKGKSVVSSKWIYKIKHSVDGSIEKYKAIFVARGFS